MSKSKTTPTEINKMRQTFLEEHAAELWDKHEAEFLELLEDSDDKKVRIAFSVEIDYSESTAQMKTKIRFSKSMTDERYAFFDDPNQVQIPGTAPGDLKLKPKKNKK